MTEKRHDTVNELLDAVLIGDGCATFLAYIVLFVVLVVCVYALLILFTTPASPPPTMDPSLAIQIHGTIHYAPTSLPSASWLP